jgi:hypothetical protein
MAMMQGLNGAVASGRMCWREVGPSAVTLTGEQVAADRDREPVSSQPDLACIPLSKAEIAPTESRTTGS